MSRPPSASARSPFVNVPLSKEPISKGKVPPPPMMLSQNMYSKGNQSSPMFPDNQNSNNKEKFVKHSIQSNGGKVLSASPSLESTKKLPSKYTLHPSHRYPIAPLAPQFTTNGNVNLSASEGRKALRAFTELRQSASSLYPSTSKTSVFLKETRSAEELIENSTTPFIHMLMSHQAEASKAKEHKRLAIIKALPKREILQPRVQHEPLSFPEFYRITAGNSSSDANSTSSESSYNASPSLSAFSSARSENELGIHLQANAINTRIEELSSSLRDKNVEISVMKSEMKNLRATVEESSKEANLAKKMLQNFRVKMSSLEDQMDILEDRVNKQETEIIEHLITKIEEDIPPSTSESLMSVNTEEKVAIKPTSPPHLSTAINFDKILWSIGDLNRRMDKMQSMQLIYANDKSGATFKQPNPVTLLMYKNGIVLGESGFRSYNVDSVKQVLIDLCKGYFPSELYTQHPNGIFINVTDKRAVDYREDDTFSGKGCKLSELENMPELAIQRPSRNQIVPPEITASVESLGSLLSKKSCHELIGIPDLLSDDKIKRIQDKIITLKLKHISNETCYKMKISVSTPVEKLILHLMKNIKLEAQANQIEVNEISGIQAGFKIDIISSAPFGILSNGHASLKDYGIEQNTLLYIAVR